MPAAWSFVLGKRKQNTMKRIILIYGAIAGAVIGGMLLITMPMYEAGTLKMDNGEILGYSTMTIAFSVIFFAVKSYRDKELNGVISFGKAVKLGLLIYLVAAVIYALCWEISYSRIGDGFMEKMTEHYMAREQAAGATQAELVAKQEQMKSFSEMYKNPVIRFSWTLLEPSPVGVIITLISAFLLRRKNFLPAIDQPTTKSTTT
jgi:hypothetical protein